LDHAGSRARDDAPGLEAPSPDDASGSGRARRDGAAGAMDRRLRAIHRSLGQGADPHQVAGQVEQMARAFIADRFNLSSEGLTRPDIERLLQESAMPRDKVDRVCDLIDQCAALSYAPVGSGADDLQTRTEQIAGILKEHLHA